MSNYLLTWNPKITKWDTLDSEISKVEKKHSTNVRWSCGMNKSIKPDDLIILMRLGREPKGIVGLGYSNTEVETRPHWKEEERLKGKSARSVKINFFNFNQNLSYHSLHFKRSSPILTGLHRVLVSVYPIRLPLNFSKRLLKRILGKFPY